MTLKKILASLLLISMLCSMLPFAAFAQEEELENTEIELLQEDDAGGEGLGGGGEDGTGGEDIPVGGGTLPSVDDPSPDEIATIDFLPIEGGAEADPPAAPGASDSGQEGGGEDPAEGGENGGNQNVQPEIFTFSGGEDLQNTIPETRFPVAFIGEEAYYTLQDAVNAAGSGETITLGDLPAEGTAVIPGGSSIVLDLNQSAFIGKLVNYGELTIVGDGLFTGSLHTRGYERRDEIGNLTNDVAYGSTSIPDRSTMFSGSALIVEQLEGAGITEGSRPMLSISGGIFTDTVLSVGRYTENEEEGYAFSSDGSAGRIIASGGYFDAIDSRYLADGYAFYPGEGVMPRREDNRNDEGDTQAVTAEGGQNEVPVFIESAAPEGSGASAGNREEAAPAVSEAPAAREFTVTYVLNGGEGEETGTYTSSDAVTFPIPSREGASFGGWYEEEDFSSEARTGLPAGTDQPITVYARWLCELSYDGESSSSAVGQVRYQGDPLLRGGMITVPLGEDVELEFVAVDRGMHLSGLLINGEAVEPVPTDSYTIPAIAGNTIIMATFDDSPIVDVREEKTEEPETLETVTGMVLGKAPAQSSAESWSIVFKTDEEHSETITASAENNEIEVPEPSAVPEGESFAGWISDEEPEGGEEDKTLLQPGDKIELTGNASYTAVFQEQLEKGFTLRAEPEEKYKVYIYHNTFGTVKAGETVVSSGDFYEVAKGSSVTLTFIPTDTTYEVYNCTLNGEKKGSITSLTIDDISADQQVVVTFMPKDPGEIYHITYHIDSETTNDPLNPEVYTKEDEDITLQPATKNGYTFNGWFTNESFSNQKTKIIKGSTGDIELWPEFHKVYKEYTITYHTNGGVPKPQEKFTEESKVISLADGERAGYYFLNWYTEEALTNVITEIDPSKAENQKDFNLYAKWEKIPVFYKVYIYYNTFGTVQARGSYVPSGSYVEVAEGNSLNLYFNPNDSRFYVYNCTLNGEKKGSISVLTISDITSDQKVVVSFMPIFARPMTGDNSNLALWVALLALSAAGVAGVLIARKKSRK